MSYVLIRTNDPDGVTITTKKGVTADVVATGNAAKMVQTLADNEIAVEDLLWIQTHVIPTAARERAARDRRAKAVA